MRLISGNFLLFLILISSTNAYSKAFTSCGGDFGYFLKQAEKYGNQLGVRSDVLKKTISKTRFNQKIIELDRKQRSFKLSFLEFSKRAVNDYRLVNGKKKFKKYKAFYAVATDQGVIGDYTEVALDYSNQIICKRNTL